MAIIAKKQWLKLEIENYAIKIEIAKVPETYIAEPRILQKDSGP